MIQSFLYSLLGIIGEMAPYILLGFLIAGVLQVFVSPAALSRQLSGHGPRPVLMAALFGVPLPLCSCGVLPTAIGLRRQGASKGATTSFLIATPQTGVDSIAATYSLLGGTMAILRPLAAIFGGVFGGLWVDKTDNDSELHADDTKTTCSEGSNPKSLSCCTTSADCCKTSEYASLSFGRKCLAALRYAFVDMVQSIGKWLTLGLLVAVLITLFVPDSWVLSLASRPWAAMIVALCIAVPMYVCATGSIPIALSLMAKGLTPGVAFVFLMAGPAVNFASMMVLGKSLGRRATLTYIASVVITAVIFGLSIDYLLPREWFEVSAVAVVGAHCAHHALGWFQILCSALFIALLLNAFLRTKLASRRAERGEAPNTPLMSKTYHIRGMQCSHCAATVQKALQSLSGAQNVTVDLASKTALVEGDVPERLVKDAIEKAGFDLEA